MLDWASWRRVRRGLSKLPIQTRARGLLKLFFILPVCTFIIISLLLFRPRY